MTEKITGRVWKFGDNIDTDLLAPMATLQQSWEERKEQLLPNRPGFIDQVQKGDIIVAGKNWGCGSSREQAADNIKELGVAALVAESFGRIFFRNSIAIALPGVVCPGISKAFEEGDELELDLPAAKVTNLTQGKSLDCVPYTQDMLSIIEKGGILSLLKDRLPPNQNV